MTEQTIQLCKSCTARKLDFKRGLLCSLTNEKPNYNNHCTSYNEDSEALQKLTTKAKEENLDKAEKKKAMSILYISCAAVLLKLVLLYNSVDMMHSQAYVIMNSAGIALFCTLGALAYYKTDFFLVKFRLAISIFGVEFVRWLAVVVSVSAILLSYFFDIMTISNKW